MLCCISADRRHAYGAFSRTGLEKEAEFRHLNTPVLLPYGFKKEAEFGI
jgi:hypothetical protein